ncbi:DUF5652 family protein [Nanoarchaeota archaeon]
MAYEALLANPWLVALISLWTIPWKGFALWKAARNRQLVWFIALLVLNTLAILEIVYIFFFQKKVKAAKKKKK